MSKFKSILTITFSLLLSISAFAQDDTVLAESVWHEYPFEILISVILLLFVLSTLSIILTGILIQLGMGARQYFLENGVTDLPWIIKVFGIFEGDNEVLTGVYQDEVIEGHDYDGIEEFDNDLPPWWVGMFYVTIIFSGLYMGYYYMFDGKNQEEEFLAEMLEAETRYKDIEQVYEGPTTDATLLASAEKLYAANCVACHKAHLGGGIGPNLTDQHWIYDGDVNGIFKTIKEGAPNNPAMKAWKNDFDNQQIYTIASFILSKQGTNPEGGKAPEGNLWKGK